MLSTGEWLFYGGLAVLAAAAVAAVVTILILRLSGVRLRAKLDAEYGKKRH